MPLLEFQPPSNQISSPENINGLGRRSSFIDVKISESIVSSFCSSHQFEGKTLVSLFLAAYHILLHRYNPDKDEVEVALVSRKLPSGRASKRQTSVKFTRPTSASSSDSPNGDSLPSTTYLDVLQQVDDNLAASPGSNGEDEETVGWIDAALEFFVGADVDGSPDASDFLFDLFLRLSPSRDGTVSGKLHFWETSYEKESIARLADNFLCLLDELTSQDEAVEWPVHELRVLSLGEESEVLDSFSGRQLAHALAGEVAEGETLVSMVERQVAIRADAVAVVDEDGELTYGELWEKARQLATVLLSEECERAEGGLALVGLGMDRCRSWVVAMVGVLVAGMGYCPLDPSLPRARVQKLVDQTGMRVVLSTWEHLGSFEWVSGGGVRVVNVDEVAVEGAAMDASALSAAAPLSSSVCYVLFTSGSTGEPKGVVVEHRGVVNMVHSFRNILPRPGQEGWEDVRGQLSAMTFDLHAMDVFCAFDCGARLAICSKEQLLTDLAFFVRRFQVAGFVITPTVAAFLDPAQVPSLRWLAFGGEQVPRPLIRKWISAGRTVIDHYGPTECSVAAACQLWRPGDEVAEHIGKPLEGAHIYVLGPGLETVPIGIPGELCISGVHVSRGYLHRPDLTARAFRPNPYSRCQLDVLLYRTGDRARWTPQGTIQFLGRIDFQVKIRGHRVEPGEVENAISKVDGVARCVVVLRGDAPGQQQQQQYLAAYLMVHPNGQSEAAMRGRVRAALTQHLPSYMVPAAYVIMDHLPQTMSGKVDRKLLPEPLPECFQANPEAAPGPLSGQEALKDEHDLIVAALFADVLGLTDTSTLLLSSNFFFLGGNSFSATQLVSRATEAFNLPPTALTVRQFFDSPTIGAVAESMKLQQIETYLRPDQNQQKLLQQHRQGQGSHFSLFGSTARKGGSFFSSWTGSRGQAPSGGPGGASVDPEGAAGAEMAASEISQQLHRHVLMELQLSQPQEVLWMLTHVIPKPEALDITDVWNVTGPIEERKLESSIQKLLARHQSLRLRFLQNQKAIGAAMMTAVLDQWGAKSSMPSSQISSTLTRLFGPIFVRNMHNIIPKFIRQIDQDPTIVPFRLHVVDLQHLRDSQERKWPVRRAVEEAKEGFDLRAAQGLLFRVTLIKLSRTESILVLAFNHLIFDGISSSIFYRELQHVFAQGTTRGLPEASSYAEYVAWEEAATSSKAAADAMAYWWKTVGKNPEPLRLRRQPQRSAAALPCRGNWIDFTIECETKVGLESVARQLGATLNMAMLAAFHLLLHIWSNQRRILVGTLLGRRTQPSHHHMLGHVADMLPIVADFRPQLYRGRVPLTLAATDTSKEATIGVSYPDLLVQIRDRVIECLENQVVTMRMLCSDLLTFPDLAKSTMIQAYFNFHQPGVNTSPYGFELGEASARYDLASSWSKDGEMAMTPLCLNLRELEDGSVKGRLVYQADVLDKPMVESMVLQYGLIVESASKSLPDE